VKRIVLLRHAKAGPHADAAGDHARPLTERGRHEADEVAKALVARGWVPELVSASDAARTQETLAVALPHWPGARTELHRSLYMTGLPQIRRVARTVPPELRTWLVLAHNPGLEEAASWLADRSIELGTASAALFECEAESFEDALRDGTPRRFVEQMDQR
jgi:phosphohistidine phosphatase